MRTRILSAAEKDLEEGYRFYESRYPGLGSYFLDSLYSDIDSLAYFGVFTKRFSDIIGSSPNGSRLPYITVSSTM